MPNSSQDKLQLQQQQKLTCCGVLDKPDLLPEPLDFEVLTPKPLLALHCSFAGLELLENPARLVLRNCVEIITANTGLLLIELNANQGVLLDTDSGSQRHCSNQILLPPVLRLSTVEAGNTGQLNGAFDAL